MKRLTYYIVLILLVAVFLFCGWNVLTYFLEGYKTQQRYEALASMVDQARQEETIALTPNQQEQPGQPEVQETVAPTSPYNEDGILREYAPLYDYNSHMVAWVAIEDTVINYPVVQTPANPEYYLHRDFDGSYNVRGCIFADGNCDVENSDNVIIYGHHMNDGSMFASLISYASRSYWEEHPTIIFDTLTEHRIYDIFAVFRTTASVGEGFAYHRLIDTDDEDEFDKYVAACKKLSLVDTGITPQFGDQLLTLSTCEYTQENGRFVVVAVKRAG